VPELSERRGIWRRFLIGAALIVLVTAASTAVAALHEINQISAALNESPRLQLGTSLAPVPSGGPENVLVIGSDKLAKTAGVDSLSPAHSDTLMLVRIDPKAKATTMLSIPRDLKVTIYPRHGLPTTQKINAAYAIGGPRLAVETVHRVTGLKVSHVVDVNFRGFREVVDALGCVYVDVDRRYFNNNAGLGPGSNYAVINVQPGYQKLCGQHALDYVRYRHTDNDIVRSARQQDFLRQVRSQVSARKLFDKAGKLINIFADNTASDIHSTSALRRLVQVMLGVTDKPIKQVKFHGRLGPSYVYATPLQIKAAVRQFLYLRPERGPLAKQRKRAPGARAGKRSSGSGVNLIDATSTSQAQGQIAKPRVGFPVYYPRKLVSGSSFAQDAPRTYTIQGNDNHRYRAYKMVVSTGYIGEYYGVQGTSWLDPPILASASETRKIAGRQYMLFFNGDRLRLVAWRTKHASYWISNTLRQTLSAREMLGVARSLTHTR